MATVRSRSVCLPDQRGVGPADRHRAARRICGMVLDHDWSGRLWPAGEAGVRAACGGAQLDRVVPASRPSPGLDCQPGCGALSVALLAGVLRRGRLRRPDRRISQSRRSCFTQPRNRTMSAHSANCHRRMDSLPGTATVGQVSGTVINTRLTGQLGRWMIGDDWTAPGS